MPPFLKKGIESGRTFDLTELIESGLYHTPSIGGMPESAQSEVAARPEAAEVPGEEKKL